MRYMREKPNSRHWEKRRKVAVPQVSTETPIFPDEFIAYAASAASRSLDELCATQGHRFRERIYPDKIVCATCGRTPEECAS